jgi:pilus assembly protein FimV
LEIGIPKIGIAEIGTDEIGKIKIGTTEIGTTKIGAIDIGTTEIGTTKIGASEIGTTQIGITEITPAQVNPCSPRTTVTTRCQSPWGGGQECAKNQDASTHQQEEYSAHSSTFLK